MSEEQFEILKIYLKDQSFESPMSPKVFQTEFKPEVRINVGTKVNDIDSEVHEVVLTLNLEGKQSGEILFIVEIEQAGLFRVAGMPPDKKEGFLKVVCPEAIFPYARQTVDHALNQGGFPSLQLAPISFQGIYQQEKAQPQSEKE